MILPGASVIYIFLLSVGVDFFSPFCFARCCHIQLLVVYKVYCRISCQSFVPFSLSTDITDLFFLDRTRLNSTTYIITVIQTYDKYTNVQIKQGLLFVYIYDSTSSFIGTFFSCISCTNKNTTLQNASD